MSLCAGVAQAPSAEAHTHIHKALLKRSSGKRIFLKVKGDVAGGVRAAYTYQNNVLAVTNVMSV